MARTRSLTNLSADVYARIDVEGQTGALPSAFVTEALNQGWTEVYGILARAGENYYLSSSTFSTTPGTNTYALPADFWLVKGVDVQVSGQWQNAQRGDFEQRNDFQSGSWNSPDSILFDLWGGNLVLNPTPSTVQSCRLWYYPAATRLSAGADTLDGGNGWEIYAIDFAARRCAEKLELLDLAQRMDGSLAEQRARIIAEGAARNVGAAPKVRRVRYKSNLGRWGW